MDTLLLEQVKVGGLASRVLVAVAHQDGNASRCPVLGAPARSVKKGFAHPALPGQRVADAGAKLARGVVAHEAQLVDCGVHPGGGRGDLFRPVQHIGYRPDGDAAAATSFTLAETILIS